MSQLLTGWATFEVARRAAGEPVGRSPGLPPVTSQSRYGGQSWDSLAARAHARIYGWVLVGLFVVGHDCGHGSFSRRRWVNEVVGHLAMAPLANSFATWA